MVRYSIHRLLQAIPTLLGMSLVLFALMHLTPGSPLQPAGNANPLPPDAQRNLAHAFGLDKPLWQQYLLFLWKALHLDFGVSYFQATRTVREIIATQLPVSLALGALALTFAAGGGLALGVLAAVNRNGPLDYLTSVLAMFGVACPNFLLAVLLILVFALALRWVPQVHGLSGLGGWVLPVIALGLGPLAILARYTRASLVETLNSDYVRTARAKGLAESRVILAHALKNALIPTVTVLGPLTAAVLTGSPFVETIFGIPGIGQFFLSSIQARDYPMIMGVYLVFGVFLVAANLVSDVACSILDPRIRLS